MSQIMYESVWPADTWPADDIENGHEVLYLNIDFENCYRCGIRCSTIFLTNVKIKICLKNVINLKT